MKMSIPLCAEYQFGVISDAPVELALVLRSKGAHQLSPRRLEKQRGLEVENGVVEVRTVKQHELIFSPSIIS